MHSSFTIFFPFEIRRLIRRYECCSRYQHRKRQGGNREASPIHRGFDSSFRTGSRITSRRKARKIHLDRLYVGAFGPHGAEIVRIVRGRYGDELGECSNCITGIKLPAFANAPAASFRAKIDEENKLPKVAVNGLQTYPEELGCSGEIQRPRARGKARFRRRLMDRRELWFWTVKEDNSLAVPSWVSFGRCRTNDAC